MIRRETTAHIKKGERSGRPARRLFKRRHRQQWGRKVRPSRLRFQGKFPWLRLQVQLTTTVAWFECRLGYEELFISGR